MYFEIYQERSTSLLTPGQWRWRLKGGNHEKIASGESYTTKENCLKAIALVMDTTRHTPVKEVNS